MADLKAAAARGVDVRLVLPGPHTDKNFVRLAARSVMDDLDGAGVHVSTYQATVLHAKVMTIDGDVASIGSANINRRSGHHDKEANIVIFDHDVVATLDDHFENDLAASIPFQDDEISNNNGIRSAIEIALRPFRPWM